MNKKRKMNMPGFTAESSLYSASERYQQQFKDIIGSASGVVPAYWHCLPCMSMPDGSVGYCCHWH
jgi:hypothetical protein